MHIELSKMLQLTFDNRTPRSMTIEHPNMAKVEEAVKPRQPSERRSMIAMSITSPTSSGPTPTPTPKD